MFGAPCKSVDRPDHEHIESVSASIFHKLVQRGPTRFRAAKTVVGVLPHDLKPTLAGELPKVVQLGFGMLIEGGNTDIKCGSFHLDKCSFIGLTSLLVSAARSRGRHT